MMETDVVTVVSGLPRSGTSMMMKMLVAGGMEALTDQVRTADEDNPEGYFEFEGVKKIGEDSSWLRDARGKAVKIISALLKHLPAEHRFKVIFMRRKMEEVLDSQRRMLGRNGGAAGGGDEKISAAFGKHIKDVESWLVRQPHVEVIYVDYNEVLESPARYVEAIKQFLAAPLDARAMASVVDPSLYRQRR
jgi:hypothetical protein